MSGSIEEIELRTETGADVPALNALIEASVRWLQGDHYTPAEMEGALGYALSLDSQLISEGTYFVAELRTDASQVAQDGVIATLCGSDHLQGRSSGSLDSVTDSAKIRAIYVHPSRARIGLGCLILAHCERQAREAGLRRLEMGSTRTGLSLCRLRGYREQERIAIALPNGEEMVVVRMTKNLWAILYTMNKSSS